MVKIAGQEITFVNVTSVCVHREVREDRIVSWLHLSEIINDFFIQIHEDNFNRKYLTTRMCTLSEESESGGFCCSLGTLNTKGRSDTTNWLSRIKSTLGLA